MNELGLAHSSLISQAVSLASGFTARRSFFVGPRDGLWSVPITGEIRWRCSTTYSGNWVTGFAVGVGAVIILPLAAPILRPLAKTAIKGGILAYQGAAGLV